MSCLLTKRAGTDLDYEHNWATRLGNDTISTSTWTVTGGIVVESESETTTTTTVQLSGGEFGATAEAINTIVTAAGNTEIEIFTLRII